MRRLLCCLMAAFLLFGNLPGAEAAEKKAEEKKPAKVQPKIVTVGQGSPAKGTDVISTAKKYQGTPYVFGGSTPKGFDCSGFVMYVFNLHGKKLPRTADKQFEFGKVITDKERMPGDVVFFTTYEPGASHCGIYVGDGKFIHASTSRGVTISELSGAYWKSRYLGARRMT